MTFRHETCTVKMSKVDQVGKAENKSVVFDIKVSDFQTRQSSALVFHKVAHNCASLLWSTSTDSKPLPRAPVINRGNAKVVRIILKTCTPREEIPFRSHVRRKGLLSFVGERASVEVQRRYGAVAASKRRKHNIPVSSKAHPKVRFDSLEDAVMNEATACVMGRRRACAQSGDHVNEK